MEIRFSPNCKKSTAITWLLEAIKLIKERGMPDPEEILKEERRVLSETQELLHRLGLYAINIEDHEVLNNWASKKISLK